MNELIKITGKIIFDPNDVTKKHEKQSSWKKTAMIFIGGDLSSYYSWFIEKRYNLKLYTPIRGSHITFINDRISDIAGDSYNDKINLWKNTKNKWHGKKIDIVLNISPRTNGRYWWLNIPKDYTGDICDIREELGLNRAYYYGLHMTIGHPNERSEEHSFYIWDMIKKGFIN